MTTRYVLGILNSVTYGGSVGDEEVTDDQDETRGHLGRSKQVNGSFQEEDASIFLSEVIGLVDGLTAQRVLEMQLSDTLAPTR
jgi:hypothetical protein